MAALEQIKVLRDSLSTLSDPSSESEAKQVDDLCMLLGWPQFACVVDQQPVLPLHDWTGTSTASPDMGLHRGLAVGVIDRERAKLQMTRSMSPGAPSNSAPPCKRVCKASDSPCGN